LILPIVDAVKVESSNNLNQLNQIKMLWELES